MMRSTDFELSSRRRDEGMIVKLLCGFLLGDKEEKCMGDDVCMLLKKCGECYVTALCGQKPSSEDQISSSGLSSPVRVKCLPCNVERNVSI